MSKTMVPSKATSISPPAKDQDLNLFPQLPSYSDPTTGLLSLLPRSMIPYAQLMRLDRPAGLYAFYFPARTRHRPLARGAVSTPMKRITDYPQVALGVAFAWAVFFAAAALGVDACGGVVVGNRWGWVGRRPGEDGKGGPSVPRINQIQLETSSSVNLLHSLSADYQQQQMRAGG
ncbi:hypothetical protein GGR53DRAFT_466356 [Hypoxylon sp. FL1150]|nr:hypothetical protein GGR53DRAFT_466356 [Hypoxylon sp. FL1150]